MYLDYSNLTLDSFGRPEVPELELRTLDGRPIGVLPYVSKLKFHIKFSELSEMEFEIPRQANGTINPLYDSVTGYKLIYTKNYGVYVVMDPVEESDGIVDIKTVTCYSLEKLLDTKRFYVSEGTYNFYNPASSSDTILGMMLECAVGWKVGYVSPSLWNRYRTFDDFDDCLLSFMNGTANEKYRCVFVFDPYEMSINVYDVDEERPALPIFLDFDNLVQSVKVEEISDELVTAIRPYGSDELDIRNVNPIGTNWIYDLSYFISNGSIDETLAAKWEAWQDEIDAERSHYTGLIGMQASTNAKLLTERAKLADLNSELTDLKNQQSVNIQQQGLYPDDDDIADALEQNYKDIEAKEDEIEAQEQVIEDLEKLVDADVVGSYAYQIQQIVNELKFTAYFTESEQETLSMYFVEQDLTEETFVATNLDTSVSGKSYTLENATVSIEMSEVTVVDVEVGDDVVGQVYDIKGGTFTMTSGETTLSCELVRGTLDANADGSCVMSLYASEVTEGEEDYSATTGITLTITGTYSDLEADTQEQTVDTGLDDVIYEVTATSIDFSVSTGTAYVTAEANEYKKYLVQLELLDFATLALAEVATPTYEFSVESSNFIFAKEFEPFKNKMELGKGIYLRVGHDLVISPIAIEIELDFEDQADFSLVFSNRFKRHDNVATLKEMLEKSYSMSRSIETSKYVYGQAANQIPGVTKFMNSSLDAAVNTIKSSVNQSVTIDGAGIHVGGDDKYQLRIVDKMIAMTDDNWQSAKLAIGLFSGDEIGTYWGVNADVIGGKLLVGNNLIIENSTDDGVMQFRVDSTGAWLNNASFVLQSDGGQLMIDPTYGLAAGTKDLYTTSGTTVIPSFIDSEDDDAIIFEDITDADGKVVAKMPKNANFYIDLRDGSVYLRGDIYADDIYAANGTFNGTVYATDGEFTGKVTATSGEFTGTIKADDFLINTGDGYSSVLDERKIKSEYLDLGNIQLDGVNGDICMTGDISMDGNITLGGDINLSSGTITWGNNSPVKYQYSSVLSDDDDDWHDIMVEGDRYRRDSYDDGLTWGAGYQIVNDITYQYSADGVSWHSTYQEGDLYRRESTDGGQTWGDAYQFIGTDANVTWENVKAALNESANLNIETTIIDETSVETPVLRSGEIYVSDLYGCNIYAGDGDSSTYAQMTGEGFYVYHEDAVSPKLKLVSYENDLDDHDPNKERTVELVLGSGNEFGNGIFHIQKTAHGAYGTEITSTVECKASIIYQVNKTTDVGFSFNDDATITVHGTFDSDSIASLVSALVSDANYADSIVSAITSNDAALTTLANALSDKLTPVAVFGE